jgi:lipoprotein-releasing system ATP-binding protein
MADLDVIDVTKEYLTRAEPLVVLRGVSLQLSAGENVAIVGPSGSGKSTLLHILGTLERPTSGAVRMDGQDPFSFDERALADFRNHHVGFVFQEHYLLPQLSVLENVLVPVLAEGSVKQPMIDRAHDLLERVGLAQRLEHRPAELSGGERQRVAVARALLRKPRVVLADEPTGSLDRTSAGAVGELLLRLQHEEQNMLVVVTHSHELANRMQRQYELDAGQLKVTSESH